MTSPSQRGMFRVRGDVIEVWPAYEEIRSSVSNCSATTSKRWPSSIPTTGDDAAGRWRRLYIYPGQALRHARGAHSGEAVDRAFAANWSEPTGSKHFKNEGKLVEAAAAARARTNGTTLRCSVKPGTAHGIENYARWFSGRKPGEPPYTLIDFFPEDFFMVVDESHVTLPQVRGMFHWRPQPANMTLVEHGWRLPERARQSADCASTNGRNASEQVPVHERRHRGRMSWRVTGWRGGGTGHSSDGPGRSGACTSGRRAARCQDLVGEIRRRGP